MRDIILLYCRILHHVFTLVQGVHKNIVSKLQTSFFIIIISNQKCPKKKNYLSIYSNKVQTRVRLCTYFTMYTHMCVRLSVKYKYSSSLPASKKCIFFEYFFSYVVNPFLLQAVGKKKYNNNNERRRVLFHSVKLHH